MLEWVGSALGVARFTAEIEADNMPSIVVAQRLGFTVVPGVERTDDDRRLAVYELNR
jgi:RimJ/RimL family protein N-acetyltransferase